MRYALLLIAYLFVACKRPAAVSSAALGASADLLNRYARADAGDTNGYIAFYAQGMKLSAKTQLIGKTRALLLAAALEPDLKNNCAAWDCYTTYFKDLKTSRRSPLFAYALFHMADLAEKENLPAPALELLAIETDAPPPLAKKISLLKGRLLQLTNSPEVAAHFRAHAEKFSDAESLYFSAAALERAGDKQTALNIALKVLDKPEADSPFSQSGLIVRSILNKGIYTLPDTSQRIRLMEALRIAKDKQSALKLFDTLKPLKLKGQEALLFTHYGARLMLDQNNLAAAANLINAYAADFLGEGNDKPALDICERLLKKKQFGLAASLYAVNPPSKSRLQCQLRRVQREGKLDAAARKIAAQYIRDFDNDSTLAERVFLRSCLPETKSKRGEISITCLEELREVTRGKSVGAGARYYLAREYDHVNEVEKVRVLLGELAADYNDDFYFFRLIEKPLKTQREYAAALPSNNDRNGKILSALVHADLSLARDIEANGNLKDLEKEVKNLGKDLDAPRQTALLLFAADSRDEARELMRGDDKTQIHKNLIALGTIADKPDIALFGMRQYLREKKIRPFLFEIPPYLRDLLYPTTFGAYVEKYGKKHGITMPEIFALIRQESNFFPGALSVANAQGLMQLLPSTAKLVARKEGMASYNLMKAEDNIRLGIGFMHDIMNNYTADYVGIAIAYNAGPGRYTQWKDKYSNDDDIFIEEIPFQETYHYVRVLLADRAKYRAIIQK